MKINIKKLDPNAVIPKRMTAGAIGADIVAVSMNETSDYIEYGTGLAVEVPEGYGLFLYPRSSISTKTLIMCNSVGVIDTDYRGELKFRFKRLGDNIYQVGERVGQMVLAPVNSFDANEVEELGETQRGSGGFGSTNV